MNIKPNHICLLLFGAILVTFQPEDCQPRADWAVLKVSWENTPAAIAEQAGITLDELAAGNCWTEDVSFSQDVLIRVPPEMLVPSSTAWEILFPENRPVDETCIVVIDELPLVILHPGEDWQPVGVLAWYAPLMSFSSTGYIIDMGDDRAGWVSEVGIHLEGDCQTIFDTAFDDADRVITSLPDFSTGLTHWITPRKITYEPETVRLVYRDASFVSPLIAEIPLEAWVPIIAVEGDMQAVKLSPHHIGWTSVYGW